MDETITLDHDQGETIQLAEFTSKLDYESLDNDVVQAAKKALVDTLAAAYAGLDTDPGKIITDYVEQYDGNDITVIGDSKNSIAQYAALANGTLAHALDVDDGHRGAAGHPGSSVVPTSIAVAEKINASGKALITGIVAGYEGMVKTAESVQPSHRERGFHGTATAGTIGAAAAASSILDLNTTQTAHAIGLAGTQSGGLFEFIEKGSMAKRFHPGRAALAGILASELAEKGFDGPDTIIEGKDGFAKAFADEYDLEPFERLGEPYSVTQNYLKPYPCCRHIHGPIEAILNIRDEGIRPDDVESIRAETYGLASHHDKKKVENWLDTQMSMPYGISIALKTGKANLDKFDPKHVDDSEIQSLLEKIEVVQTEEMEELYPEARPANIIVELKSGETYDRLVEYPLGSAEKPLSRNQLEDKFQDLTQNVLNQERRKEIIESAFRVDDLENVTEFTDSL